MVGLPGAFRQLYRKYSTLQQQWSTVYRKLFMWAWRRKRLAMQHNRPSRAGWLNMVLARLVPQIDTFLGGNLRYIIVCDRDMPSDVKDFLEVTLTVKVLSAFGFPEAGGLVTMQSPSIASPKPELLDCDVITHLVGHPLPCNELKLVPVWLGAKPPPCDSVQTQPQPYALLYFLQVCAARAPHSRTPACLRLRALLTRGRPPTRSVLSAPTQAAYSHSASLATATLLKPSAIVE